MKALLLICALLGSGADPAAEAYRSGRFEEAYALYQEALAASPSPAGELLFNLGNCAYRLGRHAEAVLFFRRARLRMPRDPELRFNLFLAEQPLGMQAAPVESFGAGLAALVDSLTARELLLLAGGIQGAGLVGLVLLRGRRAAQAGLALLVLLALAGAGRSAWSQWGPGSREGLVLAPSVALRPAPHGDLEPTLRLRAGEAVRVLERSDRWLRVAHERGSGWAEGAGVGVVD